MARSPELFDCIGQKLHHNKPAIRLNLLRIIGSICGATDEGGFLLERFGLYEAIRDLQVSDSAVLVRSMAQELIRSCEESENVSISGGTNGQVPGRRKHPGSAVRRASASTTPPHLLERQMSIPTSPQLGRSERASMGLFEGPDRVSQTPRRQRTGVGYVNGSSVIRPASRDSSGMAREGSPAFVMPSTLQRSNTSTSGGSEVNIAKSRLPTTTPSQRLVRQSTRTDSGVGIAPTSSAKSTPTSSATSTPGYMRARESQYFDRKNATDVTVAAATSARRTAARRNLAESQSKWT